MAKTEEEAMKAGEDAGSHKNFNMRDRKEKLKNQGIKQ